MPLTNDPPERQGSGGSKAAIGVSLTPSVWNQATFLALVDTTEIVFRICEAIW